MSRLQESRRAFLSGKEKQNDGDEENQTVEQEDSLPPADHGRTPAAKRRAKQVSDHGQVRTTVGPVEQPLEPSRRATRTATAWLLEKFRQFTLFPVHKRDDNHWQVHGHLDQRYSLAFIVASLLVAVVIGVVQWRDRPTVLIMYMSDNPVPGSGASYCGCGLPDYLADLDDISSKSPQIKSCYELNGPDVETVTVISFSNSTVPELLDLAYSGVEEFGADLDGTGAPLQAVFKVIHDTYLVTSTLSELDLWEPDPQKMLAPLYEDFLRYFEGMETVDMEVDEILRSRLFHFPPHYMFMMVQFDCVRYSACGPRAILSNVDPKFIATPAANSTEAVANDWLTCGGYDGRESWDPIQNQYHGRCMIYPTYPTMSSRVKKLLQFLQECPQIGRMGGYTNTPNVVSFISHMEQVNNSRVAEHQPMVMGFLEVKPNSPQWFRLADQFPGIRSECSASTCVSGTGGRSSRGAWTEVCNASSVCLTYKTAAEVEFSSVRMQCMDFDRYDYTNCVAFASSTGNMDRVDDLCNPDASCKKVPSRKIRRQVESQTKLNNMNVKVVESKIKASAKEGVCRNTFHGVVRYFSGTLNQTVLLETNCSTSRELCTLTGRYNLVDDEPGTDFPRLLLDQQVVAAASTKKPFVCYGPGKQKSTFWAVTTAGVISGWIHFMYFSANVCRWLHGYLA